MFAFHVSHSHFFRSSWLFGSMKPITIVKRSLNQTTPPMPLLSVRPVAIDYRRPCSTTNFNGFNCGMSNRCIPTTILWGTTLHSGEEPTHTSKRSTTTTVISTKIKTTKTPVRWTTSPRIHCFASSLTTEEVPQPAQASIFLNATAKSLPSPATFRKAVTSLQSTVVYEIFSMK